MHNTLKPFLLSRNNPRRYRLDFINENTFNRVWTVRMGRVKVVLASLGCVAALIALIFVVMAYTPVRRILPGGMPADMRVRYQTAILRVDSLERAWRLQQQYLDNVAEVIGRQSPDSASAQPVQLAATTGTDTLPAAGEAERAFVRAYDDQNRFNLSVLAPIAAEGMIFSPPVTQSAQIAQVAGGGLSINPHRATPVSAIYRGTVAGVYFNPDGTSTIVVQHPNDFVSIYGGVGDVFVERGQRIVPGQRIAHTGTRNAMLFELWHNGTSLDPRDYMAF